MEQKKLQANLESVAEIFFEPVQELFKNITLEQLSVKIGSLWGVKSGYEEKITSPAFVTALLLLDSLNSLQPNAIEIDHAKPNFNTLCFELIKNYLQGKTYPYEKSLPESYPWSLPKNKAWCALHLKNKIWYEDFKKTYKLSSDDLNKKNFQERVEHHLEMAKIVLTKLKNKVDILDLPHLEALYKQLSKNSKVNSTLLSELQNEIKGLRSALGQIQAVESFSKEVTIEPEFNPMEILEMGNLVNNSCLNTYGVNFWSVLSNALDVNKRVLWAKDNKGRILGRLLIAVDDNRKILRFRIYYASSLSLEEQFNDYIKELAKKCGFGLNGTVEKVSLLIAPNWYLDPVQEIK